MQKNYSGINYSLDFCYSFHFCLHTLKMPLGNKITFVLNSYMYFKELQKENIFYIVQEFTISVALSLFLKIYASLGDRFPSVYRMPVAKLIYQVSWWWSILFFLYLKIHSFCFHFCRIFPSNTEFWFDRVFVSSFRPKGFLPSGVHGFWWEPFSVPAHSLCVMGHMYLALFSNSSFTFVFHQFDYNVSGLGLLCVCG